MKPEEKAQEYADKTFPGASRNDAPYITTSDRWQDAYDAWLAGYNADRWIAVTPETVAVEGGKYLVWVKHNYEDREEVVISKKLHTTNVYWTITHYQIITPPTK